MDRYANPLFKLLVPTRLVPRTFYQWMSAIHPGGNLVFYMDPHDSFNRWAWLDFFERHEEHGVVVNQLRVADYDLDQLELPELSSDVWVRGANEEERTLISRDLLDREDPRIHKAFDYEVGALSLTDARQGEDWPHLKRERDILVAGIDGRLLGYAVLESSAPGVNLFSLLDTARINFFEQVDRREALAVRDALFARAVAFYRQRGIGDFLLLRAEEDAATPFYGAPREFDAARALVPVSVLPRWTTYLNDIWVHRKISD